MFSQLASTQLRTLSSLLLNSEYPLPALVHFLHALYQHDLQHTTPYTASPSFAILSFLFTALASSSFSQQHTSSCQLHLASLAFCCVHSSLLFLPLAPAAENPLVQSVMQAVSRRLGEGSEPFRDRIVGIAKDVALLIQPDSHYDWPVGDLTELVQICDVETHHREEEEVIEEVKEVPPPEEKKPTNKPILDMDEEIDVFAEERRFIEESLIAETKEDSVIPDPGMSDGDDEFLPYDLTEPQLNAVLEKEYHFLREPLADFADEDYKVRLHAWKSLLRLSAEGATAEDVRAVLDMVLSFEEMQGDDAFWEEFATLVSVLLYHQSEAGMQCVLEFVKKNGRNNLTVNKCVVLLQAVQSAVRMLTEGRLVLEEEEKTPEPPPPVVVGAIEENGLLRVAKTKYRPSFYRNKLMAEKKESRTVRAKPSVTNRFTENSRFFLQPLVTWALRVPPRSENAIGYLVTTLSRVCSAALLTAVVDENYRDLCAIMTRYRFHRSNVIRRSVLELFLSLTKYGERECVDKQCLEFQSRERVREWMESIVSDDTDDLCRALASSVLYQLREWVSLFNKQRYFPSVNSPSTDMFKFLQIASISSYITLNSSISLFMLSTSRFFWSTNSFSRTSTACTRRFFWSSSSFIPFATVSIAFCFASTILLTFFIALRLNSPHHTHFSHTAMSCVASSEHFSSSTARIWRCSLFFTPLLPQPRLSVVSSTSSASAFRSTCSSISSGSGRTGLSLMTGSILSKMTRRRCPSSMSVEKSASSAKNDTTSIT